MKAVISCGAAKIQTRPEQPVRAFELYQGCFFQKMLAAAVCVADDIYILSAEYGLLRANDLVYTYERKMTPARAKMLKQRELVKFDGLSFLSETYGKSITGTVERVVPHGLRMGEQMSWLTEFIKDKKPLINLANLPRGPLRQPLEL